VTYDSPTSARRAGLEYHKPWRIAAALKNEPLKKLLILNLTHVILSFAMTPRRHSWCKKQVEREHVIPNAVTHGAARQGK
jgi:hypothetical protein